MKSSEIIKNFENEIKTGKVSASYLFYGDRRVDLLHYALIFSKMVMTRDVKNEVTKLQIEKQIDNLVYPDVEIINKNNGNIKIDEVREIIYETIESSFNSPKKIFIIFGVENLRKESANALLKTIEEPPKDVYFILLSRTLNIIPTIKSRVIKFHLESLSSFELEIDKKTYDFFDGNENDIKSFKKNYLEKNITLESFSFKIKTVEDILKNISEMQNYLFYNSENGNYLDLVIKYNKSIEFLVKEVKFWNMENIYFMLNELEIEVKKNREFLINFLAKIIINAKVILNSENLKKLIEIKNSVRNNVNIRSILFNFFNILYNI
ncbi:ATPase [Leptotrichia sp. HSP-334]|uniref:ATPase n=1 Tax=Leptotrichia rugosa TaxID=3239302 RepID=A0AB39VG85_9FUSO